MAEPSVAELLRRVVATLPAGEVRAGQVEMAEAVAKALASGGHVAVAAGTGTGKSLAYLVPAVSSHKRVVVATATKALQDQLANKDLPLVARGLGQPVKWAVLKGRSNYLCRQRLYELERLGEQQRLDAPFAEALDVPPDVEAFGADPSERWPWRTAEQLRTSCSSTADRRGSAAPGGLGRIDRQRGPG